MPRVPTYGDQQVQTRPLAGAKLTYDPGNPGAAIGQGLQKLGGDLTEVALKEKEKQAQIAVLEADRKLSSWSIDTLNNPETGALNVKGKDALALPDQVMPAFDQQVQDLSKGLANDAQRNAFNRLAGTRRLEIDQSITKHAASEMHNFENSELEAYTQNAHDAALANPSAAGNEIERQRIAIGAYADRNGMGPEWFKLKFGDAASKTHLGVLDGLLAQGQDQAAKAYFDKNSGQLIAEDRTRAEKALDVGTLRGDSQRLADKITQEYGTPEAMMAAVEQIKDPKVRDATEERVQRKIRFLQDVNKQQTDKAFLSAWSIVENTGDVNQIQPSVWAGLPPANRSALEKYAKQKARGDDVANDDAKWLGFMKLTDRQLTDMSEADIISQYLPSFDRAHRERAMTMWGNATAAKNGNPGASAKHASTRTFNDLVSTTLSQAGLGLELGYTKTDLKKLNDEKQKVVADFEAKADSAVKQYEITQLGGKRAATTEEMQKVIDGLLVQKVLVDNRWMPGNEQRPAAVLTESERKRARWPDAPRDVAQRTAGQTYHTPKGELTWTGTGWRQN